MIPLALQEKFWDRVEKTNMCWLWKGSISNNGYGVFWYKCKTISAHRFSWEIHNSPVSEHLYVCHTCDVKNCVNPDHLFLGTASQNAKNRAIKARTNRTWKDI